MFGVQREGLLGGGCRVNSTRRTSNSFPGAQACQIHITCSSRESGDSTRTSRTSRKTMVTSGSICSSHDMVFFSEIK